MAGGSCGEIGGRPDLPGQGRGPNSRCPKAFRRAAGYDGTSHHHFPHMSHVLFHEGLVDSSRGHVLHDVQFQLLLDGEGAEDERWSGSNASHDGEVNGSCVDSSGVDQATGGSTCVGHYRPFFSVKYRSGRPRVACLTSEIQCGTPGRRGRLRAGPHRGQPPGRRMLEATGVSTLLMARGSS